MPSGSSDLTSSRRPRPIGCAGAAPAARETRGGAWCRTAGGLARQVPSTGQAVLAARIDRVAPEDKRLLPTASVVGKNVPFARLLAIAELPDEALRGGLDHLQAAEIVSETGPFPDLEYSFKLALTHDVTYGGLLQERRRELHARIVDAIETLHRDRLGEHIERLAHHAFRAELRSTLWCSAPMGAETPSQI